MTRLDVDGKFFKKDDIFLFWVGQKVINLEHRLTQSSTQQTLNGGFYKGEMNRSVKEREGLEVI